MSYVFLSTEWLDEVEKLRHEMPAPPAPPAGVSVDDLKINVTVTGGPDGDVAGHLVGTQIQRGHFDGAPTTITVPYDVAKAMFVEGNPQAAMQAFMAGQIKVEGDMTKLMSMASAGTTGFTPTPEMLSFQARLRDMTV